MADSLGPWARGAGVDRLERGHHAQLDAVAARLLANAWAAGAGSGSDGLVIDLDSTVCEVHGHAKQGAAYCYTRCLGYHPVRRDTGRDR